MIITSKELELLDKLSRKEKAIVACKLNAWKNPKPFKYLKNKLSTTSDDYNPKNIRTLLIEEIHNQIGDKAVSAMWWKIQELGTKAEHKSWWKSRLKERTR